MNTTIKTITIVGGGTAGWITAGVIAAEHITESAQSERKGERKGESAIEVRLIESPDIKPIGVGEGSWPSMRGTLQKMGISETDFILACDASFKQGSRFIDWASDNPNSNNNGKHNNYYHPFALPQNFSEINLATHWLKYREQVSFADAVSSTAAITGLNLAPKQITTAEYAFNANYGYHLNAGKFSEFLKQHCIDKLNVQYIRDTVTSINSAVNGDIDTVTTQNNGDISGDLFIDCTGEKSLLLGEHLKVPFISQKHHLFNDSALAVQLPYAEPDTAIASCTLSTAQSCGWIWDIGLSSRRGVGYVYSSAHSSDEQAEQVLRQYITKTGNKSEKQSATPNIRKLSFNPGHRSHFWHKNCVAIGMSAGFIEPLEASALALVELSAKMVSEQLPATRATMDIVAKRFNDKFLHRWQNIIEFLKLHYVLSNRTEDYWRDNREQTSIPQNLQTLLTLWQSQTPYLFDTTQTEALFPAASYQYVLYGMGFVSQPRATRRTIQQAKQAEQLFADNSRRTQQLCSALPTNRQLLDKITQFGLPKI